MFGNYILFRVDGTTYYLDWQPRGWLVRRGGRFGESIAFLLGHSYPRRKLDDLLNCWDDAAERRLLAIEAALT